MKKTTATTATTKCRDAGYYGAQRLTEWRAFHDFQPQVTDESFTVTARLHGKSSFGLKLQPVAGGDIFSLNTRRGIYDAVALGDRLVLPVEIGRGGVARTSLPTSAQDLRHN